MSPVSIFSLGKAKHLLSFSTGITLLKNPLFYFICFVTKLCFDIRLRRRSRGLTDHVRSSCQLRQKRQPQARNPSTEAWHTDCVLWPDSLCCRYEKLKVTFELSWEKLYETKCATCELWVRWVWARCTLKGVGVGAEPKEALGAIISCQFWFQKQSFPSCQQPSTNSHCKNECLQKVVSFGKNFYYTNKNLKHLNYWWMH